MASTNQSPEYKRAELSYLCAKTPEEKILALEEMIRTCPKHKSSEKMLAGLRSRLAKLKKQKEEQAKKGRRTFRKKSIGRQGDAQIILIGMTNSGKSSLLATLTKAKPMISDFPFTTKEAQIGTMLYSSCVIDVVGTPSLTKNLGEDAEILSLARQADLVLVIGTNKQEIQDSLGELKEARINKKILQVKNKHDIYELEIPNALSISTKTSYNIDELKEKIFKNLDLMRIYTKEPKKEKSGQPIIMHKGDTIKRLCEKIHRSYIEKFLFAKVLGTSTKFPWQQVGLQHELADKDVVEIHLKK